MIWSMSKERRGGKGVLKRDDWERVKGKEGRRGWRGMIGSASMERRGGRGEC